MVQHRIRKCLNGLTPDKTNLKLSKSSPDAKQIQSSLKALHGEAIYKCKQSLEALLNEPSQAGFAIVEEFIDRVLRAKAVKREWRIFLNQERSSIWPSEFELLNEHSRLRKDWLEAVEKAGNANHPGLARLKPY